MELSATVVRVDGNSCLATGHGKEYRVFIPKRILSLAGEQLRTIAVGDEIIVSGRNDDEVWLQQVMPRQTWLARRSVDKKAKEQVVVANVEQMAVVTSVGIPPFRPGIIDRMIVAAMRGGLEVLIVVNKSDLREQDSEWPQVEKQLAEYRRLGYAVFCTSATKAQGVDELREQLRNRKTVFAGHSGVGKSSLLLVLDTQLDLRVQDVSYKTQWGQHTTTAVSWLPFSFGGVAVDTPGIREFSLWQLTPQQVASYFPEIAALERQCRYKSCTHIHEPDCAVKAAVSPGNIAAFRYHSYCRIVEAAEREVEQSDASMEKRLGRPIDE
jgi:ribosome biogenesis GTPase